MSASMLAKAHIDALLTAGLRSASGWRGPLTWFWPALDADSDRGSWTSAELQEQATQRRRLLTTQTAGRVGALLLAENRRSLDHRYDQTEWEEPYLLHALPLTVTCKVIIIGWRHAKYVRTMQDQLQGNSGRRKVHPDRTAAVPSEFR